MRRVLWIGLIVALGAPAVQAGGPPGGGRRGGPGGFFGQQFFGRREKVDLFDTVRRYFDLTEEQQAAVAKLDDQHDGEERAALAELSQRLDKKYLPLVAEVLPAEEKAKFEKAFAAMAERDAAVAAAEQELRDVLDKVRTAQGGKRLTASGGLPTGKAEIIRRYLNLSDDQRKSVDEKARGGFGAMRDLMRDVPRPQNFQDTEARRKYGEAMRKAREQADDQTATTLAALLTDEQQKAYRTAADAFDATQKKIRDAEETCRTALVAILGAERAARPAPMRQGMRPPGPPTAVEPKKGGEF